MVPKLWGGDFKIEVGFRAVLFRMVPKPSKLKNLPAYGFRAVLFRMVPKRQGQKQKSPFSFRAVLFRMVPSMWDT